MVSLKQENECGSIWGLESTLQNIFLFCDWIHTEAKFPQLKLMIEFPAKVVGPEGDSGT